MKTKFFRIAEWEVFFLGCIVCSMLAYLANKSERSVKVYTSDVHESGLVAAAQNTLARLSGDVHQIGNSEKLFILTGKLKHLTPRAQAKQNLKSEIAELRNYLSQHNYSLKTLDELEGNVQSRMQVSDHIVTTRENLDRLHAMDLLFQEKDQRLDERIFKNLEDLNTEVVTIANNLNKQQVISSDQSSGLSRRFFMLSLTAVIVLVLAIFHNLKRRRQMEIEIERNSQFKSQFLAYMSHDIRTPLNAIIGMTSVLAEAAQDQESRKLIETIRKAGDSLLSLINDILDLSKIESGGMKIEDTVFDMRRLVADTIEIVDNKARSKNITLLYKVSKHTPSCLRGDPFRLQQIILNLLGNAIKFSSGGEVELVVRYKKNILSVSVRDSGIGIAADKLKNIFDVFQQAELSTTRQYGGTGLGLAICKQLVQLMHGRIKASSRPGTGSLFKFSIPILQAEHVQQASEAVASSEIVTETAMDIFKGKTILIADDSEDNRVLLQCYFKNKECRLLTADNGQKAFEIFQNEKVDCVLMDMQMPVMDGYEATRKIRELEKINGRDKSVVVALTAAIMAEEREASQQAGCTDFLSKPVRKQALFKKLDELMKVA